MPHNDAVLNDLFQQVALLNQKLTELVLGQKPEAEPQAEPIEELFEMPEETPFVSPSRRVFDELNSLPIMQRFKTTQRIDGEHGHGWLNVSINQAKWGVNFSVTDVAVGLHCGTSLEPHLIEYCKRKRVELLMPADGFEIVDRRLASQRKHWQRPSYRWVMTEQQQSAPNTYASLLEMAKEAALFLF